MYANKPSVPGLLDKLRVEIGSHDSHIYMVYCTYILKKLGLGNLFPARFHGGLNFQLPSYNPVML